jgi:catechol 2,3-dioxygenase-like lactoylglutathione lyase family enzyme
VRALREGKVVSDAKVVALPGEGSSLNLKVGAFFHGTRSVTTSGPPENQPKGQEAGGCAMLEESDVATRLPAQDLSRARKFYSEKLDLEPVEERPGGLRYRSGNHFSALFKSSGEASGSHTQMGWEVIDIEATVAALKSRGVVFEEYDLPGLKTVNGIVTIAGNYPSKGVSEKGSWFKDSEGNLLSIGQPVC